MQDEATFKQEGVPFPGLAAGAQSARPGRGPSILGPGADRVEPEQATVNAPKLLERPVPARANPMAVAASSAAGVDVSPPSVLLRHPDRGTGALFSFSPVSVSCSPWLCGPERRAAITLSRSTAVLTAALLKSMGRPACAVNARALPLPTQVHALLPSQVLRGRAVAPVRRWPCPTCRRRLARCQHHPW